MTTPNPEKLSEANRWLDKAIRLEADGKSGKMVDMALGKAVAYENEAFGGVPAKAA